MPIPLGANRPWAWSFFEICIFTLTIFVVWRNRKVTFMGVASYTVQIYLWLAFIIFSSLQIIALPKFIVAALSPTSLEAFLSVGAPAFYLSVDPSQSTTSFIKLLSFFCLLMCTLSLVDTERRIKLVLYTMVASGTVQALYGSLEILLGLESSLIFGLDVSNVATGSFVYKNHYANFLMLCLAAGVGLLVTSLEKSKMSTPKDFMRSFATTLLSSKAIVRICIAVMVIGLVMSRSRMGNTAFFMSMAVVGGLALVIIRDKSRGLSVLVISMFIIDLFIVSAYFGLERVKERLAQTSLQQESRDEVVADAYPMLADFPLFGSGGGSFYSTFPSYQEASVDVFYDHLHNDYLQFLIEYGILGGFILSTILLFSFYKAVRAMYKRKNSIFKGTAFACLMALIGMCVHMTVDFPLQGYANAAYFVVFIALCMIINSLKLRPQKNKNRLR
ncbi:O-antigen ligase family protein [Glaciecola petra]|uniref:O-antigen ligase family protein n=1 Tax=Glaciecola petra TaxID=3075602 RepID=A0ABU2ZU71_9ALTE|nr:O-antigen ligase family protein [Aestuariibacter sp. P117]MDT0595956.1 O-antigen ligase family protein [Aestuariibacter sp. P117]